MQLIKAILILVAVFLTTLAVNATPSDTHSFDDPVTEKRYRELIKELRCPKCQNQNLADSNSQISIDLRNEVYRMLNEGKADMEITDYMVDRYGEFVLYRPRVSSLTYILWFAPAILLLIGVIVVVSIARRKTVDKGDVELSEQQQQALDKVLTDKDKS
ncbi:cytochrome c-type biogenesis protein [Thalassotalea atypica]|uniref:cytochrome c-type biogenesis protein n=1 Tax=Thalassotalea atypica TaxID=2054316 RepID=UPI0025726C70|nr:cytochrome c-type biogenesis protein [Thalassotalea atypica]